jgi:hypothetical protein
VSSSSDSEAAAVNSFGSASNSSSGSPSVPYHVTMQQQQQPRPDSPTDSNNTLLPNSHLSLKPPHPDSLFNLHSPTNQTHAMYNNIHDFAPSDHDQKLQQSGKLNGYGPSTGAYRQSAFASFTNNTRPRHHNPNGLGQAQYRDPPPPFAHPYPTAADVFGAPSGPPTLSHMTSPTLSQQQATSFETLHQGRGFDYNGNGSQPNGALNKQTYNMVDPYGTGSSSGLLQIGGNKSNGGMSSTHNNYGLPTAAQAPYVNGLHIQSQTPYGPHLQTNGPPSNTTNGGASGAPPGINHVNGAGNPSNPANEEISTIFVVGFPEDMQVSLLNLYLFGAVGAHIGFSF